MKKGLILKTLRPWWGPLSKCDGKPRRVWRGALLKVIRCGGSLTTWGKSGNRRLVKRWRQVVQVRGHVQGGRLEGYMLA